MPGSVELAVGAIDLLEVRVVAADVAHVVGEPVPGRHRGDQVPLLALGPTDGRLDELARDGDVPVASAPHRAVAQEAEVSRQRRDRAHDRFVVHRPVVQVREGGLQEVAGAEVHRLDQLPGSHPHEHVDDPVTRGERPRPERRVDRWRVRRRRAHLGMLVPGSVLDQPGQGRPGVRPPREDVAPRRVPHEGHEQPRRPPVRTPGERLAHHGAVGRVEPAEPEHRRLGGRDVGDRDRARHASGLGDDPGAVPQHGHLLEVVPRPRVHQAAVEEIRLVRHDLDLTAAILAHARRDPTQLLGRQRARGADRPGPGRRRARLARLGVGERGRIRPPPRHAEQRDERDRGNEHERPPHPHAAASVRRHGIAASADDGNAASKAGAGSLGAAPGARRSSADSSSIARATSATVCPSRITTDVSR